MMGESFARRLRRIGDVRMKRLFALFLAAVLLSLLALPAAAARPTHGTSDTWITQDMLTTEIPDSYSVNRATQADARLGRYNDFFLKDRLQTVSIQIEEDNFNYLVQNAKDEPYVLASSVTIGNATVNYCGLRTKGNFTLDHSYADNPGSDRFSFTVNFGEYVCKPEYDQRQTFYGCERISINNFFFDKSMLKEFFSLMLMEEMGLPTPQFGLAKLYINGEYYGVYAMVEAMDESILEQHFQEDAKELSSYLCKPTGTRLRYADLQKDPSPLYEYDEETYEKVKDMLPTALEWSRKLSCLAAGQDFSGNAIDVQSREYLQLLGQVMDVEQTLKYFAAHSWLCQMDNMFVGLQNFGLYISPEGVSTLVPWDYDLAFGCYFPSTAENTANYPVDVMYRLNVELWDSESKQSAQFYKTFPLFYVIYQNKALMERYRGYMLDCSRIAALGGYVEANGKSYEPAWFNSFIETLEEPLLEAAGEKLASNVYYMNYITQPKDAKAALPHLTRIIAQRAAGVYNQIMGIDAWVCGSGCNLETLGNGIRGDNTTGGTLTLIDPYTGISSTAAYSGGRRSQAPVLGVRVLSQKDKAYQTAHGNLNLGMGDRLAVYELKSAVKPTGRYTVTIPLGTDALKASASHSFYLVSGDRLVPLEAQRNGNLFTFQMDTMGTVAVLTDLPVFSPDNSQTFPILLGAGAGVAVLAAVAVIWILRKKKKQS